MPIFENRFFQSHLHPQNQRLAESSALNPCYRWLSNGRCTNQKTLDYEIETIACQQPNRMRQ